MRKKGKLPGRLTGGALGQPKGASSMGLGGAAVAERASLLQRPPGGAAGTLLRAVRTALLPLLLCVLVARELQYRSLGCMPGGGAGGGDVPFRIPATWKDPPSGLKEYPKFNLSDPIVLQYANMVEENMLPWTKLPGIDSGMGARGMVTPNVLKLMGGYSQFMSCSGHVRIIDGEVFFRYGGFLHVWYRLRRFNQNIKMIQDAVRVYGLTDIRVEFFLNNCDSPISFDSGFLSPGRSGYPLFSTQWLPGTTDVLIPDPLDLSEDYTPDTKNQVPWEQKKDKAIFRGASTSYDLRDDNWRSGARFRLHRMTDALPDLIDARIMRWSHALKAVAAQIESDGLAIGDRINQQEKNAFKYEIVVDGGVGTCRTCGVIASNQAMVRQGTAFKQFFEPMLKPGVHYLLVERHFQDLPDVIRWARQHDAQVAGMVKPANDVAKWACTWEGRTLYWAVVLAKYYYKGMEDPSKVEKPETLCQGGEPKAILQPLKDEKNKPPTCGSPEAESTPQPQCTHFCVNKPIPENKWYWLPASVLDDLDRLGPHQEEE